MKKLWVIAIFCALAAAAAVPLNAQPSAEHVVLISIDGLRPEFYVDKAWPAPMIQQMAEEGVHAAGVQGVFPSVTYPSHTTIITGALPSRHGIYYNTPFEPEGQTGRWNWEESLIQIPTLWDALRQAGRETANLTWPVSVGAPIDRNIPEVWPLDPETDPMDFLRRATRPEGLWEELEREASGRLKLENFNIEHMTRDDRAGDIAAYLLETYRPALLTVHLLATDHFQHEEGREGRAVRRAVATVDRAISQIVEAAERAGILETTAFIVTGDHGFMARHTTLAPNIWLVEAALMEPRRDRGQWRAAFHTTGGAAFLHLRDPEDQRGLERVREILSSAPPEIRKLFRVVERDELDRIGADPRSPLALASRPGIVFSSSNTGSLVRSTRGGTHGFWPEYPQMLTGFVGWGAGFNPGARIPRMGLEDIAPIIAHLLELEFEAPDGVLYPGVVRR